MTREKSITIYTDGACDPNPGAGGYGVVILNGDQRTELSGGFADTTNNRMELMGAIVALESLIECQKVKLYSDSKYLTNSFNEGWIFKWEKTGWNRKRSGPVKNIDLWKRLLTQFQRHEVKFIWVKGHSGNTENERCDILASDASREPNLPEDINESAIETCKKVEYLKRKTPTHCKHCGTELVRSTPKREKLKPDQPYFYEWYLKCPTCNSTYNPEEAKRHPREFKKPA